MPLDPTVIENIKQSTGRLIAALNAATDRRWSIESKTCNLDVQFVVKSGWYQLQTGSIDMIRDLPLTGEYIQDFVARCQRHMLTVSEVVHREVRMGRNVT